MRKPKIEAVGDIQLASRLAIPLPAMMRLSDIKLAPYNPRTISKDKLDALKRSIVEYGLVVNLVVQKTGNVLVGGHQRIRAMREVCSEKGWRVPEELPAVVLDISDAEAKLLNVALNNVEGEFEPYKLGELLSSIRDHFTHDEMLLSGFDADETAELIRLVSQPIDLPPQSELGSFGKSVTLSIEFETVAERDEAKGLLAGLVTATEKPGRFILQAIKTCAAGRRKQVTRRG